MNQNMNLSECNLFDLNDDCLVELYKYLNWMDAFNFAATCRKVAVAGRYKFNEFKWPHHGIKELNYFDTKLIFNIIGPSLVSLCILGTSQSDTIMILDNCTQLKSLKLTYCAISYDLLLGSDCILEELKLDHCILDDMCWNGLTKLKHLEISSSSMLPGDLNQLLENNVNLEILKLSGAFEFNYLLLKKLEKLHLLRIGLHEDWILDVVPFLLQLKKIEINCWLYKNMNEFIHNIDMHSSLEELTLEKLCFDPITHTILQATKFRSLILIDPEFDPKRLNVLGTILKSTMSNVVELKLTLSSFRISPDQMINFIGKMKCVKELNLYECRTNFYHFLNEHWETTSMKNILRRIQRVLKKHKRKSALMLIMPKRMMFRFGKKFAIERYSINPLHLNIPKPTNYDADFRLTL